MQETIKEKKRDSLVDEKIIRTVEETETGTEEGTIEPGLHSYQCKYTITRHSYEPYEILMTKSYGSYGMIKKGEKEYGNNR